MKQISSLTIFIFPVIAVILVIYQIVISNELASLGKELGRLNNDLSFERDINELLMTEVASSSSFLLLRKRAESLGFTLPLKDQIIALSQEPPVAFGATLP